MTKLTFLLSSIMAMLSLVGIYICTILRKIMPLLGRMAYQAAASGSYDPYDYVLDLDGVIAMCLITFCLSLGVAVRMYFLNNRRVIK